MQMIRQTGERFSALFDEQGRMRIHDGMRYYKKTHEENNMVCVKVALKEPVDPEFLLHAFEETLNRLRVFRLVAETDGKVFYLRENRAAPVVHLDDGSRRTVCTPENNGYMIRVGYRGNVITIDFFHGVSDGTGVIAFQKTLLYYYFEKKYGRLDILPPHVILRDTPEDPREYADSLLFVEEAETESPPKLYKYDRAFQLPGERMESGHSCRRYTLLITAETFEGYMRKSGTSRSAMFAMFMNRAIAEEHDTGGLPIVAALAADARKAYGAEQTLQCCVCTVPVWYDENIQGLPWPEQLCAGRKMILAGVSKERILSGAQNLKKFNRALEENHPTLAEKKAYARTVNERGSVKYTYGISCQGEMDYGADINRLVMDNYVLLCANTIPVILEITKWNARYHVNYCTHLKKDPYIGRLTELFLKEGIPCTCTQEEDFVEAYADF